MKSIPLKGIKMPKPIPLRSDIGMLQYIQSFYSFQAQQFEWVKVNYPKLYVQMKKWIKAGRFIPVGGCWCEMVTIFSF